MNKICIYLRKSRTDEELERTLGEGETLIKHRKALLKFAKEKELNIVEIKEEIVSGDSLFFRPKMLELLKEVEANKYDGVLVMDIDRLGRGGMKDQGIILEAFKESHTLIITPSKTYNLNDDIDEEMTEFKTFFARRELKVINKRMQGGRIRSIQDGNYIATNPPLGYDITFIKKFRTLKINDDEAEIIHIIFKLYIEGNGARYIADYLNNLGFRTKVGNKFTPSSILFIIKNPVYIGKVTWKKKDIKQSKDPNKITNSKSRPKDEWIVSDGKHKPIIDEITFKQAQEILKNRYHIPYQLTNAPHNPVAGIAVCGICGNKLIMRSSRGIDRIMCIHKCGNISVRYDLFENEMLKELEKYLKKYKFSISIKSEESDLTIYKKQQNVLNKELENLRNQKNKLFDLLEREIYTEDVFLERSKNIEDRITKVTTEISKLNQSLKKDIDINEDSIIQYENAIKAYESTNDVKLKNELLKSILYKIEYLKDKKCAKNEFKLKIFPKILR